MSERKWCATLDSLFILATEHLHTEFLKNIFLCTYHPQKIRVDYLFVSIFVSRQNPFGEFIWKLLSNFHLSVTVAWEQHTFHLIFSLFIIIFFFRCHFLAYHILFMAAKLDRATHKLWEWTAKKKAPTTLTSMDNWCFTLVRDRSPSNALGRA